MAVDSGSKLIQFWSMHLWILDQNLYFVGGRNVVRL